MMDDIALLKLENKGLRLQNQALKDELLILKRYKALVERATETVQKMPSALAVTEVGGVTKADGTIQSLVAP